MFYTSTFCKTRKAADASLPPRRQVALWFAGSVMVADGAEPQLVWYV